MSSSANTPFVTKTVPSAVDRTDRAVVVHLALSLFVFAVYGVQVCPLLGCVLVFF